MLTDKEIFDAIKERRPTVPLTQEEVNAVNAVMYPQGAAAIAEHAWDRQKLEDELTLDEGKKLKAYRDTKSKWTCGIGHNLDDCGSAPLTRSVQDILANGINEAECDLLFDHDIKRSENDLDKYIPWWRKLDPVRQRVMLNMCFNMGWGAGTTHGLHTFVNTLGMIEHGEYSRASEAMLKSAWASQVGIRANRLANMMKNGRT